MTALDRVLKHRDTTLPTKVCTVKAMVFPVVMYGCESWTTKAAQRWRMMLLNPWYWKRLWRVPWTARRSNQSIQKEINPEYSRGGLMLKLQYFGHLMLRADLLGKTLKLERLRARGEEGKKGWDGWMASSTRRTWVWANSRRWWRPGKPGALRPMRSQRLGHDSASEQQAERKKAVCEGKWKTEVKAKKGHLEERTHSGVKLRAAWCTARFPDNGDGLREAQVGGKKEAGPRRKAAVSKCLWTTAEWNSKSQATALSPHLPSVLTHSSLRAHLQLKTGDAGRPHRALPGLWNERVCPLLPECDRPRSKNLLSPPWSWLKTMLTVLFPRFDLRGWPSGRLFRGSWVSGWASHSFTSPMLTAGARGQKWGGHTPNPANQHPAPQRPLGPASSQPPRNMSHDQHSGRQD